MSRIDLIDEGKASKTIKAEYARLDALGFSILNVYKMFANNEGLFRGFSEIVLALYQNSELKARYRELAYLRASQINACHY